MPIVIFKAYIICAMVVHNVAKFLGAIYGKMTLVTFRALLYLCNGSVQCNKALVPLCNLCKNATCEV
jgi:hypothetical protein